VVAWLSKDGQPGAFATLNSFEALAMADEHFNKGDLVWWFERDVSVYNDREAAP